VPPSPARRLVASLLVGASALAVDRAPAARADDAPKPSAPATGKKVDPILALIERLGEHQPLDVRLAALKDAAEEEDIRLVAPLGKLLKADERDVRLAAVAALARNRSEDTRRKSSGLLLERSKILATAMEKDLTLKAELIAVLDGLHDLAHESTIDGLLDGIEAGLDRDVVSARTMAVASVPSAKAIEALIGTMARRHRDGTGIRAELTKALVYATGVKGGNDDDAWRSWWRDAKATFDFQAASEARARLREARETKADAAAKKAADRKKKGDTTPKDAPKPPPADGEKPKAGDA
jgi:HEAT repeat protein